jgi:hypothetical protein
MKTLSCLSLLLFAMAGCAAQAPGDRNAPGYTGRTTVIGNNSTVTDDADATRRQQITPPFERH